MRTLFNLILTLTLAFTPLASAIDVGQRTYTNNPTLASVSSSATSVALLAATTETRRKYFSFYNNSTQIAYVKKGTGAATSSDYWLEMAPESFYETEFPVYQGAFTVIWASANGAMLVTYEY